MAAVCRVLSKRGEGHETVPQDGQGSTYREDLHWPSTACVLPSLKRDSGWPNLDRHLFDVQLLPRERAG